MGGRERRWHLKQNREYYFETGCGFIVDKSTEKARDGEKERLTEK